MIGQSESGLTAEEYAAVLNPDGNATATYTLQKYWPAWTGYASAFTTTYEPRLAVGNDGRAVVAYYDTSAKEIKVYKENVGKTAMVLEASLDVTDIDYGAWTVSDIDDWDIWSQTYTSNMEIAILAKDTGEVTRLLCTADSSDCGDTWPTSSPVFTDVVETGGSDLDGKLTFVSIASLVAVFGAASTQTTPIYELSTALGGSSSLMQSDLRIESLAGIPHSGSGLGDDLVFATSEYDHIDFSKNENTLASTEVMGVVTQGFYSYSFPYLGEWTGSIGAPVDSMALRADGTGGTRTIYNARKIRGKYFVFGSGANYTITTPAYSYRPFVYPMVWFSVDGIDWAKSTPYYSPAGSGEIAVLIDMAWDEVDDRLVSIWKEGSTYYLCESDGCYWAGIPSGDNTADITSYVTQAGFSDGETTQSSITLDITESPQDTITLLNKKDLVLVFNYGYVSYLSSIAEWDVVSFQKAVQFVESISYSGQLHNRTMSLIARGSLSWLKNSVRLDGFYERLSPVAGYHDFYGGDDDLYGGKASFASITGTWTATYEATPQKWYMEATGMTNSKCLAYSTHDTDLINFYAEVEISWPGSVPSTCRTGILFWYFSQLSYQAIFIDTATGHLYHRVMKNTTPTDTLIASSLSIASIDVSNPGKLAVFVLGDKALCLYQAPAETILTHVGTATLPLISTYGGGDAVGTVFDVGTYPPERGGVGLYAEEY